MPAQFDVMVAGEGAQHPPISACESLLVVADRQGLDLWCVAVVLDTTVACRLVAAIKGEGNTALWTLPLMQVLQDKMKHTAHIQTTGGTLQ